MPDGWVLDLRVGVDGCESTAKELDRLGVDYLYSPENVGTYRIRNSLIERAPADAYAIFDADDTPDPDYLEAMLPLTEGGAIAGPALRSWKNGRVVVQHQKFTNGVCVVSHGAWERLGGYRDWRIAADHDLLRRAKALEIPIRTHPDPVYTRRLHPDSLTASPEVGMRSILRRDRKREAARLAMAATGPDDLRVTPVTVELHPGRTVPA